MPGRWSKENAWTRHEVAGLQQVREGAMAFGNCRPFLADRYLLVAIQLLLSTLYLSTCVSPIVAIHMLLSTCRYPLVVSDFSWDDLSCYPHIVRTRVSPALFFCILMMHISNAGVFASTAVKSVCQHKKSLEPNS